MLMLRVIVRVLGTIGLMFAPTFVCFSSLHKSAAVCTYITNINSILTNKIRSRDNVRHNNLYLNPGLFIHTKEMFVNTQVSPNVYPIFVSIFTYCY